MDSWKNCIVQATEEEIDDILHAALDRYCELLPDREASIIVLPRTSDRNEQLDRVIEMLQNMKSRP